MNRGLGEGGGRVRYSLVVSACDNSVCNPFSMLITCHNSLGLCQNLSFSLTLCLSPLLSQSIYLSLYISFFLLQSLSAKPTWNFMCQVIERVAVKYPEFVGAVVAVNLAGQVGAACFGIG